MPSDLDLNAPYVEHEDDQEDIIAMPSDLDLNAPYVEDEDDQDITVMPSDLDLNAPYFEDEDDEDNLFVEISDEDPKGEEDTHNEYRIFVEISDDELEGDTQTDFFSGSHITKGTNRGNEHSQGADHHQQAQAAEQQTQETEQQTQATEQQQTHASPNHHKGRLREQDKLNILFWLLDKQETGKLPHGSIKAAAQHFRLTTRTISKVWNQAKKQKAATGVYTMHTNFHKSGRKRIQVTHEEIANITMGLRSCIRDLAFQLNKSTTTIWRMIKRGIIKPHTNALHPGLQESNKVARLVWILRLILGETWVDKEEYHPMFDFVHLDEKWFYLTRKSQRVYLAKNERGKHRAGKSSKFIPKVMFTAVVARPHFNSAGECTFNGKIGIFPFTHQKPAERSSKNRKKGTLVTKIIESVNKKVTRDVLINKIIPAIKEKWPENAPKTIFIQQDNARTHITQDDGEWQKVYQQDGFTFILLQQPPNSPDLNILDLGFFSSIQSLMHKKMPKDVDQMLDAVNEAFYELDPKTLNKVWLTLQYVMNEILKVKGGNDFDLPHANKKRMEAQGNLPYSIKAPKWAIIDCWDYVHGYYEAANMTKAEETHDVHEEETTNTPEQQYTSTSEQDQQFRATNEPYIPIWQPSETTAIRQGPLTNFEEFILVEPFGEGTSRAFE